MRTGSLAGHVRYEELVMPQYLLSIYQPDTDPPPAEILGPIMARLRDWNEQLTAAGAWVFTAGMLPASTATVLQAADGGVAIIDGPYVEGKEHLGGFTVIRAADLDAALSWGRQLAEITTLPVEVRPMLAADGA
jgi:hypothetical protein